MTPQRAEGTNDCRQDQADTQAYWQDRETLRYGPEASGQARKDSEIKEAAVCSREVGRSADARPDVARDARYRLQPAGEEASRGQDAFDGRASAVARARSGQAGAPRGPGQGRGRCRSAQESALVPVGAEGDRGFERGGADQPEAHSAADSAGRG